MRIGIRPDILPSTALTSMFIHFSEMIHNGDGEFGNAPFYWVWQIMYSQTE